MQEKERFNELLQLFAANTISEKDFRELMALIREAGDQPELYFSMKDAWEATGTELHFPALQKEPLFDRITAHPVYRSSKNAAERGSILYLKHHPLMKVAAVAVLILAAVAGTLFYLSEKETPKGMMLGKNPANDVKPGGNKAYLSLADGQVISLTDAANGKIANQAGTSIRKTSDGQLIYEATASKTTGSTDLYNTIQTPNGGQFQIVLPDGTVAWLNAASSLKYPVAFTGKTREVELTGEGYFEVKRNAVPFIVKTSGQEVKVLGTHFNINAYPDEHSIRTTLLEGSVMVTPLQESPAVADRVKLVPGQQSRLSGNGITVGETNVEDAVAWKNGLFRFEQADIRTVMRELARWYNVKVTYEGTIPDFHFEGAIERNLNLSDVLDIMEKSNIHFRLKGKEVTVMP